METMWLWPRQVFTDGLWGEVITIPPDGRVGAEPAGFSLLAKSFLETVRP